jgi:hypothetical protein
MYEERIVDTFAKSHARLYCLGCNANDPDDQIRTFLASKKEAGEELPFEVLSDHDQKITDVLGGRRTPHAFVFDEKNVLRYAGTIDSDPAQTDPAEKRIAYLGEAIDAVAGGHGVSILMTSPVG